MHISGDFKTLINYTIGMVQVLRKHILDLKSEKEKKLLIQT